MEAGIIAHRCVCEGCAGVLRLTPTLGGRAPRPYLRPTHAYVHARMLHRYSPLLPELRSRTHAHALALPCGCSARLSVSPNQLTHISISPGRCGPLRPASRPCASSLAALSSSLVLARAARASRRQWTGTFTRTPDLDCAAALHAFAGSIGASPTCSGGWRPRWS